MIKLLGIMDLFVAGVIIGELFLDIPWRIAFAAAIYLLIKTWLFWPDIASILDGIVAVIIIIGIFYTWDAISWGSAFYIGQKAIAAFL
ncbi:MAG: hypothetical protein ACMXYL_00210 [Candidatus Woesearchaeota archaeon]